MIYLFFSPDGNAKVVWYWVKAQVGGISPAGSGKSFLIKQISACTTKNIYVTNTTGRAAKALKNKSKTIHSFAEIGDCHEPLKRYVVCFMFCVAVFCFLFQKNICLNKLVHAF